MDVQRFPIRRHALGGFMFSSIIERELAENLLGALCKYAKHILFFHIHGFLRETSTPGSADQG